MLSLVKRVFMRFFYNLYKSDPHLGKKSVIFAECTEHSLVIIVYVLCHKTQSCYLLFSSLKLAVQFFTFSITVKIFRKLENLLNSFTCPKEIKTAEKTNQF